MQANGTLATLLAPVTVADFFSQYWEKEPLHIRRDLDSYYSDVLTVNELDRYFQADNLSPDFLRAYRGGADCPLESWTTVDQRQNTDPYRIVAVEKLFQLFNEGATIILNATESAIPSLKTFACALERELEILVQTNIYITPAHTRGFDWHYDVHDFFVLQIWGSKQWRLYDRPVPLSVEGDGAKMLEYETEEPAQTIDLQPGDLLYLPRGTVHIAPTSDKSSVHVTAGLLSKYWFHLIEELAAIARQDVVFRHAIPHRFSSGKEQAVFAEQFSQALQGLLVRVELKHLVERLHADFVRNQQPARAARFADLLSLDRLNLNSTISRRPGVNYSIEQHTENLVVKFAQREVKLPRFMALTLELLLREEPHPVREIKGPLSDEGRLELVRKFVQSGLLRIHEANGPEVTRR
jgi:ribosomal protein L16 Arg81 hydroxylase